MTAAPEAAAPTADVPPGAAAAPGAAEPGVVLQAGAPASGAVPGSAPDANVARTAGRGGLAVAFAKVYFILQGLVQQIALPRVFGLDGYGAWSTVNSLASVTYNPINAMSIQGVSRAVAAARPEEQKAALRRVLIVHTVLAVVLGCVFFLLAPAITEMTGAPHLTLALRILSGALLLYALYAPLIGALNGQRRFLHQAAFDILAATLRTIGLVAGAWYVAKQGLAVEGAAGGFVIGLVLLLALAIAVVGVGKSGPGGTTVGQHLAFIVPVLAGQVLLNALLQADLTLLRRFAADAAMISGRPLTDADPLVGSYRATQLFSFLPYQLLIAVNFILFPMLAQAVRDGDRAAIARYVKTGVRIALIVAGAMVSVTGGLSRPLLKLVFGAQAAELGGRSLELLALGFGVFAIFGVLTTVLNSLKRELASMLVTGIGVAAVGILCFARVRGTAFGEELLFRTASATSVGLGVAAVGAGILVHRAAGGVVPLKSALRVPIAVAITVSLGRLLPAPGALATLLYAATMGGVYLALLLVTRELGKDDWKLIRTVLGRQPKTRG